MADSKKYDGSQWEHSLRKLTTATEAVENPLYSDGTAITAYTIKGNTIQNGTPTPTNPVFVQGVGELDGGQYKIPISNGQQTTNIYLGSTQTTRRIRKLVLDGTENWRMSISVRSWFYCLNIVRVQPDTVALCTHYQYYPPSYSAAGTLPNGGFAYDIIESEAYTAIAIVNSAYRTIADFKAYLAQQYAAGTPVTVWYILATPETGTVNEPLMKIGDYADTLSNAASIPTTEGANNITVDTTVQPSKFTATWTGWHDSSVKEWDGSDWN